MDVWPHAFRQFLHAHAPPTLNFYLIDKLRYNMSQDTGLNTNSTTLDEQMESHTRSRTNSLSAGSMEDAFTCGTEIRMKEKDENGQLDDTSIPRRKSEGHWMLDNAKFRPWLPGDSHLYLSSKNDPWEHCRKLTEEYDAEMCNSWKSELDYLLIFAGLFSATVTAFTIESYKWLQSDSDVYEAKVLALIYEQLNPTSGPQNIASITDAFPDGPVIRINICWFLSLTLGLATVLIGIVVAQWIREYERNVSLSPKDRLALRHMRYEGLVFWQVPRIVAYLPLLLQAGFILFMLGMLELLWMLDKRVAIPVSILVGLTLLFLGFTVILPAIQYAYPGDAFLKLPQCAFKSPQSLGFLRIILLSLQILIPRRWVRKEACHFPTISRLLSTGYHYSWVEIDLKWRKARDRRTTSWPGVPFDSPDIVGALDWLASTYHYTTHNVLSVLWCIQQLPVSASVKIIRKISSRLPIQSPDILENTLAKGHAAIPEDVHHDIINIAFLRCYHKSDPILLKIYWESQIRLMNTRSIPRSLVDWKADTLPMDKLSLVPLDTQLQLLHALNELIRSDVASPGDIESSWQILRLLTTPSRTNLSAPEARLELTFELFQSLEKWLSCSGELTLKKRLSLCLNPGILLVAYAGFYESWNQQAEYRYVISFVKKLNRSVALGEDIPIHAVQNWSECMRRTLPPGP